jgi:hypothetical protein
MSVFTELEEAQKDLQAARMQTFRPVVESALSRLQTTVALTTGNIDVLTDALLKKTPYSFTDKAIEAAIKALGSSLSQKPAPTEAEQREDLETQLKAEGASSTLIAKFKYMSLDQLRAKLEELENARRWKTMSHSELKAEVAAQSNEPAYEQLPYLSAFAFQTMDGAEMRELIHRYGKAQVDARLAELQAAGEFNKGGRQ